MAKGYSNRKLRATAAVNILVVSLGVQPAIAQEAFFTGLGYLYAPLQNGNHDAYAISADGSTVVGVARSPNGAEAFRWTAATGMVGLGDLPGGGFQSYASDVSADGSVVVGWGTTSEGQVAIRWTEAGGMESLGFPGGRWSRAAAVSADGTIVVGTAADSNWLEQAFRWTRATGVVGLGFLDPSEPTSFARGVSADGSIVVGYSPANLNLWYEAFRWTEQTGMVRIGGRRDSLANAVSDDGRVIVGTRYVAGQAEAFRWTEWGGQLVGIGTLPGGLPAARQAFPPTVLSSSAAQAVPAYKSLRTSGIVRAACTASRTCW